MEDNELLGNETVDNTPTQIDATERPSEPSAPLSVRDRLNEAIKQARQRDEPRAPRVVDTDDELKADEAPEQAEPTEVEAEPEAPKGPPTAWNRQAKALWNQLPPEVQAAITKREADGEKGVKSLQTKYQELDASLAKVKPHIDRLNIPVKDLIEGAGGYIAGLASPQRLQVAARLLQQFNIHPAQLLPPGYGQQQYANGQSYDQRDQALMQMAQRLDQYEQQNNAQIESVAHSTVEAWAKDKPHYEAVRQTMAKLIQSGAVPLLHNGHPDLDGAYNKAVRMDDAIWNQVQRDERAKEQAARKAQTEAKKRAAASIPSQGFGNTLNGAAKPQKGLSVRDSLRQAIQQLNS